MGSFFKGTEQDVTTTSRQSSQLTPFEPAQQGINSALGQLTRAIQGGPFRGPFIGDQSAFTRQALQGLSGINSPGSNPLQNATRASILNSLQFSNPNLAALEQQVSGGLLNPFIQQQFNAAAEPLTDQFRQAAAGLSSQFSNLGRLRGGDINVGEAFGRQQDALARGLGVLGAQISGNAFENQANRQFQAASQLGQFGNIQEQLRQAAQNNALGFGDANLRNINALLSGGSIQDARNQAEVAAAEQQFLSPFNFAQAALQPINQVGSLFGLQSGEGRQTTPVFGPSPFSQIAGLGLGIAGLGIGPGASLGGKAITSLLG